MLLYCSHSKRNLGGRWTVLLSVCTVLYLEKYCAHHLDLSPQGQDLWSSLYCHACLARVHVASLLSSWRPMEEFSNVFFLIFGPLMMFLMHPYAQKRSWGIYGVSVLFMVIGLFSMYFHMTLSFVGQLLDEISILWLLASGYSVWLPRCYFPKFIKGSRFYFSCLVIMTTIISTFLTFVKPTVNAYALNSIAIHILYIVRKEYKKTSNRDLRHLIAVSVILWAAALTSWVSDRVLCSFWQRIQFFYLHSIWHVLISITFPYGIVTMALVDAKYEMPDKTLKVHYWPRDSWLIGLPYVEIQENDKNC